MKVFKFSDNIVKELWCPNTYNKYATLFFHNALKRIHLLWSDCLNWLNLYEMLCPGSYLFLLSRESSEASKPIKQQIKDLKRQEVDDYLAILENASDFVNAINWLPAGYLWSQSMSSSTSGFFGVISSLIKMYRMHAWRRSWKCVELRFWWLYESNKKVSSPTMFWTV